LAFLVVLAGAERPKRAVGCEISLGWKAREMLHEEEEESGWRLWEVGGGGAPGKRLI
jgi:hypothetical protein